MKSIEPADPSCIVQVSFTPIEAAFTLPATPIPPETFSAPVVLDVDAVVLVILVIPVMVAVLLMVVGVLS